mgnify:CR=1 FL=1
MRNMVMGEDRQEDYNKIMEATDVSIRNSV